MKTRVLGTAVAAVCALFAGTAGAVSFTPGNVVVYRVGDGSAVVTGAATAVFLEERSPSGALVQSIALPTAMSGLNQACTAVGTSTTEGFLTRSADGQYLIGGCYAAIPGAAAPNSSAPGTVPRVVFRVDSSGSIDTTTSIGSATATGNIRGATSANGSDLWFVTSSGGNHYASLGSTTATQISTTATNVRTVQIESGQLYGGSGAGAFRLYTVGTGLPTTAGQTMVNLPGYPASALSGNAFFFADLSGAVAGVDTVYQADDAGGTGGIKKYSLVTGLWALSGTIDSGSTFPRGLTGSVSAGVVTLFATRNGTTLVTVTDSAGHNTAPSTTAVTTIATNPTNTVLRGVAFAPVAAAALPTLTIGNASVVEGASGCSGGTTAMQFTVTSSAPAAADIHFTFSTTNGTATSGSDFSTPGTGTISTGNSAGNATVAVNCDDTYEENETFTATLIDGASYDLGTPSSGTGTITNDDPTPYAIVVSTLSIQSLDSLASSGTSSTLPTGYAFAEVGGDGVYLADDGSTAINEGVYSFGTGTSTERALGTWREPAMRGTTATPYIGARLQNNTGDVLKYLWVKYTGEQWKRAATDATADRLDFQYSTNATSLTDGAATWTDVDTLDFSRPTPAPRSPRSTATTAAIAPRSLPGSRP